jgi:hypothetical protein
MPKKPSWIVEGDPNGFAAKIFTKCMATQKNVISRFTEEEKRKGLGFACRVIVTGEGGGVFDLCFSDNGIQPRSPETSLRNEAHLTDETLLRLMLPDLSKVKVKSDGVELMGMEALEYLLKNDTVDKVYPKLYPMETPEQAFARGDVELGGDYSDIDEVMWTKIFKAIYDIIFPIGVKSIMDAWKKK